MGPTFWACAAAFTCAACAAAAWLVGLTGHRERRRLERSGPLTLGHDYVIIGAGPSGCYLARLLAERFPDRSVCIINRDGAPPSFWKIYFVNLIGVVLPWLVPSLQYRLRSHKRQFANATYIGGNTNINAAVGPVPTREEIESCLGSDLASHFDKFASGSEIERLSKDCLASPGLERLSKDLNERGVKGSRIRVFSDGFRRIHPGDLLCGLRNVTVVVGHADRLEIDDASKTVQRVICNGGVFAITPKRRTFLCAGALESPKILIKSGVGPADIIHEMAKSSAKASEQGKLVLANEHIGMNLQDHWVGRASAEVPSIYTYETLYPHILGYKHQYKDVAMGFGKLQLLGKNLVSFATTACKNPGQLVLAADGQLEPYLPVGADDMQAYQSSLSELIALLGSLGIVVKPKTAPLSPNWHLSCTLSVGTCVDPATLQVNGLKKIHVADVSVLRKITPMNTQIVSYAIPFMLLEEMGEMI
ncbi:Cellobiose dehydrogenase [Hondaea fermentalgiana]|uniref:Cellobiose dehydrogenase n=1 Tax=Hondaea fermentalgiana TaxID=2315210 RepID=A0A2R5GIJ4_9STRA|nr:Cellobiose dehydrogenase [Hondaea fermentalgiana]|eukprot:GBG30712.1 Cellobiose dehydrogenase [Hondaea fermentalgiana]